MPFRLSNIGSAKRLEQLRKKLRPSRLLCSSARKSERVEPSSTDLASRRSGTAICHWASVCTYGPGNFPRPHRISTDPVPGDGGAPHDDVVASLFTRPDISDPFQILERTSDAVFTVDRDWRVTSWNSAMTEWSGMQPETVLGRTLWDIGHAVIGGPFPDELEAQYRRAMDTGTLVEFLQHIPEPTDHWIEVRLFADERGLSIFMRDITGQEEQKRKLERREFLFRRAQELSSIGVWELNLETESLWWSEGIYRIHGVDATYTPTLDEAPAFYHPEDRTTIQSAVQQAIETGERYSHRLRIIRPSGEVRHVLARGEVVCDESGHAQRLRGTFQDVTKLERTKRELQLQNERLDAFGQVVAHDIRSPLAVAMGFADLAEETGDLQHLRRVQRSLRRMNQLVEDLMVLARSKQCAFDMEPLSLQRIAQSAWTNTATDAHSDLEISSPLGTVRGNAGLLARLFENLFRNALEHSGNEVTVRVGPMGLSGFYVEDNGPGIPPEQRERAFEHGYTTNSGGTGMGLSIVREIATAHGWSARIVDADSGGARFEFQETPPPRPHAA
jgi:PAS domain S-box-containing protein